MIILNRKIITAILLISAVIGLSPVTAGELIGRKAETKNVNESGKGYSKTLRDCAETSGNTVFNQATFRAKIIDHKNDREAECSLQFDNYVEFVPGIYEPQKACLVSYVKGPAGLINYGKYGRVRCKMTWEEDTLPTLTAGSNQGYDSFASINGLPADIERRRQNKTFIDIAVPLKTLLDKAVLEGDAKKVLSNLRFIKFKKDSLHIGLSASAKILATRCDPVFILDFPRARLKDFGAQVLSVGANCRTSGILDGLGGLPEYLAKTIREETKVTFIHKLFKDTPIDEWAESDPDLATLFNEAYLQGRYCYWRAEPAICLKLSWSNQSILNERESKLLAALPQKEGDIDEVKARQSLSHFIADAQSKNMYTEQGYNFPAGFRADGELEDADMTIFSGIMCRSGLDIGCELIRNAQSSDGRFWRSPRRIGDVDKPSKATFSGDQLKGLIQYFIRTNDRERLEKFLLYLKEHPTYVPSEALSLESGYSSCPNGAPNFTCLLAGQDWYLLETLATIHGLTWALPDNLDDIKRNYNFDFNDLVWDSLITNNGYRLHLIANVAWAIRSMSFYEPQIDRIINILAAREPNNPFFNYLALGKDSRVQRLLDKQCNAKPDRGGRYDWAWQRAEKDKAWERSMGWDCASMYKLLLDDPIPYKPWYDRH